MPTVQQVIMNLTSGIDDPSVRMEIARTIMFLSYVYASGRVEEDEVRRDVEDVVRQVVRLKHPELAPEEQKRLVEKYTEMVMDAFRVQSIFRRTAAKFSGL